MVKKGEKREITDIHRLKLNLGQKLRARKRWAKKMHDLNINIRWLKHLLVIAESRERIKNEKDNKFNIEKEEIINNNTHISEMDKLDKLVLKSKLLDVDK